MDAKPEEEKAAQTPSLAVSSTHRHILFAERHQNVTLISVTLHSAWGLRRGGEEGVHSIAATLSCRLLAVWGTDHQPPRCLPAAGPMDSRRPGWCWTRCSAACLCKQRAGK